MDPNLDTSNKKYAQRLHARQRAMERYGIEFNKTVRRDIVSLINRGSSQCLERQTKRISVHLVKYNNQQIKIVYDKIRHEIVTVLPLVDDRPKKVFESQ